MGEVRSGLWWEGGRGVILVGMGECVLELVEGQQQQASSATVPTSTCSPKEHVLAALSSPLLYCADSELFILSCN